MTQRDLFRLISKVFGLYFLVQIIPAVLASLSLIIGDDTNIFSIVLFFVTIAITIVFIQLLLFTPDKIVDKILSKPFEVQSNSIQTTVWYASIILGFYLVISPISPLLETIRINLTSTFFVFDDKINYQPIFINSLKIVIGVLLIVASRSIANFLGEKNKENQIAYDDDENINSAH